MSNLRRGPGTITVSGATVTGTGTQFTLLRPGAVLIAISQTGANQPVYSRLVVASVASNTTLTIAPTWTGPAITAAVYEIDVDTAPGLVLSAAQASVSRIAEALSTVFSPLGERFLQLYRATITERVGLRIGTGTANRWQVRATEDAAEDLVVERAAGTGTVWAEAARINRATGAATLSLDAAAVATGTIADARLPTRLAVSQIRERLTANRNYWVSPTGSNSNSGLGPGAPFQTIQHAVNTVAGLDIGIFIVTIQLADGTYNDPVVVTGGWVGSGTVQIQGNSVDPSLTVIHRLTSGAAVQISTPVVFRILHCTINAVTTGVQVFDRATFRWNNCIFAGGTVHINADYALVEAIGNYRITGNNNGNHILLRNARAIVFGRTVTVENNPAFSFFVFVEHASTMWTQSTVWSGTATGTRYRCQHNSAIITAAAGELHFPGSANGQLNTGGQYI